MFRRVSAALLLIALAPFVAAQDPLRSGMPKPRGPIKITAERADLENRESALYRGNVRLTSEDVVLTGDRLELKQPVKGQVEAKLTGKPAQLQHKGQGDVPPVLARAATIVYDSRKGMVDLSGDAHLERGTDVLTSQSILYDLVARRISASGTGDNRVQIVIQPPNGENTPAPSGNDKR